MQTCFDLLRSVFANGRTMNVSSTSAVMQGAGAQEGNRRKSKELLVLDNCLSVCLQCIAFASILAACGQTTAFLNC